MIGLGDLPGGAHSSTALAVSADGSVVVGWSSSDFAQGRGVAFRWTEASGMDHLGNLGGDFTSSASATSGDGSLVVGISQSGQSPDIVGVVEEGRSQGALTLAITNEPASPLARAAELVLDTAAGPERAVAATKTYTAQLMAIALLSEAAAGDAARRRFSAGRCFV